MAELRLHRRRGRLGRLVRRHRLTEDPDVNVLAARGGRRADIPRTSTNAVALVHAASARTSTGATSAMPQTGARRAPDLRAARQAAGRLEQPLHHDAHPRPPLGLRQLGRQRLPGLDATRSASPYFQKLEDQEDDTSPTGRQGRADARHRTPGMHDPNPTSRAFIDACPSSAIPSTDDFNGPNMEGAGWHHINVRTASATRRATGPTSSRRSYRENLTVEPALAGDAADPRGRPVHRRRVPQGRRAARRRARRREVIVCARRDRIAAAAAALRASATPQNLRPYGIERAASTCRASGENFHNHVLTGVIRECKQPVPTGKQNLSEARSSASRTRPGPAPDLQIAFVHVPVQHHRRAGHPNSISILPGRRAAAARAATSSSSSADPTREAARRTRTTSASRGDRDRLVAGGQDSRARSSRRRRSRRGSATELMPADDVRRPTTTCSAFVRATADSYHHQAGSCKMGTRRPRRRRSGAARPRRRRACASPTRASCRSCRRATATPGS